MMKHMKRDRGAPKHPLMEMNMNSLDNRAPQTDPPVVLLKDTTKSVAASSSSTVNTVIDVGKLKDSNQENKQTDVPCLIVTQPDIEQADGEVKTNNRATTSKTPSTKSRSTMSTVQENLGCVSFKSSVSPTQSPKGTLRLFNMASTVESLKPYETEGLTALQTGRLEIFELLQGIFVSYSLGDLHF